MITLRKALLTAAAAAALALVGASPALAAQPLPVSFHRYTTSADFLSGSPEGVVLTSGGGAITYGTTAGTEAYSDSYGSPSRTYNYARWTSPWFQTGFGFSELVASWNADTPAGTWIKVEMKALTSKGAETKWYTMGRWAYGESDIFRNSVGGQGDANGYIAIDTFFAKDKLMTAYRLRASLYKLPTASSPTVSMLGAVASDMPNAKPSIPSALGGAEGIELNVPRYSQEIHAGDYPQYDGGGEAWCSPTSTSMILGFWGKGPSTTDYQYVLDDYGASHPDPWVDYAARYVYDYHYNGGGNWPFNTAYAAHFGVEGFVTQLRSLTEAEQFIKAGIPLVASIAANPNKLTGFTFDKGTNGHLTTIVGFEADGDVISNDPASWTDATVRHVYDRAEFERAWLPASGGIVYVIHPSSVQLPPAAVPSQPNW